MLIATDGERLTHRNLCHDNRCSCQIRVRFETTVRGATKMNPYSPLVVDRTELLNGSLTCPYCSYQFALTWARYCCAPLGNHRCPACQEWGHLELTAAYFRKVLTLGMLPFVIAGTISFSLLRYSESAGSISFSITIPIALLLAIIMDKHFESTRPFVKI